jgi:hypothetical protein
MSYFKILSVAALLSAAISAPAFAQQAVQEPGLQAFYQSLGVGSQSSAASALALAGDRLYASVPTKRSSTKHYANARRM